MLIQIIHIFYYHGRFHVLDVEFMTKSKILQFSAFEYIFCLRLQMAVHNF